MWLLSEECSRATFRLKPYFNVSSIRGRTCKNLFSSRFHISRSYIFIFPRVILYVLFIINVALVQRLLCIIAIHHFTSPFNPLRILALKTCTFSLFSRYIVYMINDYTYACEYFNHVSLAISHSPHLPHYLTN